MVLIHGLQNSIRDIKRGRIDMNKDVIQQIEDLNQNRNGNVFILCHTGKVSINIKETLQMRLADYVPRQVNVEGLRNTIDWVNRKGDYCYKLLKLQKSIINKSFQLTGATRSLATSHQR